MPLPSPEVDIIPFITDWSESEAHPTDSMDHECKLLELRLNHPIPTEAQNLFDQMFIEFKINKSTNATIKAIIQCPNGIVQL